jgi:hypothetical protein
MELVAICYTTVCLHASLHVLLLQLPLHHLQLMLLLDGQTDWDTGSSVPQAGQQLIIRGIAKQQAHLIQA